MVGMIGVTIPTEPIGSLPRPPALLDVLEKKDADDPSLNPLYEAAVKDTIERFEATGSPVITDGEQRKYHNFLTYCVHGLANTAPEGFKIPVAAGHTRRYRRSPAGRSSTNVTRTRISTSPTVMRPGR